MRANPVKQTLRTGGRACGAMVFEFFSPGIAQICSNARADFVLYDMEHAGTSMVEIRTPR